MLGRLHVPAPSAGRPYRHVSVHGRAVSNGRVDDQDTSEHEAEDRGSDEMATVVLHAMPLHLRIPHSATKHPRARRKTAD